MIIIEYFHKFIPPLISRIIGIVLHFAMIGFCVVTVVGGWPLQILQSKMMVPSFPLPQNFFSMPVMVSMILVAVILVYHTWVRLLDLKQFLIQR